MGLALHHSIVGEGAEWVLLLHGLFGSGDNLGGLARALAASGDYRAVLVDLRNHGRSPQVPEATLDTMAEDIATLQDRLGIDRCSVVGHSLGGKVAMQFALNAPLRVGALVIADVAPVAYTPHHQDTFTALASVDLAALQSRQQAERQLATLIPESSVRLFLLKSLYRDRDEGDRWRWRFNLPALQASYPAMIAALHGGPFDGPTLFIKGGLSDYILPEHEPSMRALFPHYRLETIEGTGHWLHGEKPEQFNALVFEFLNGRQDPT